MGRTHLQDAVPIRMGQEFSAYSRVITRDLQRVTRSLDNLREINMGATAVGTGLNADPRYIAKVTEYLVRSQVLICNVPKTSSMRHRTRMRIPKFPAP